jgi:hypothetical protein
MIALPPSPKGMGVNDFQRRQQIASRALPPSQVRVARWGRLGVRTARLSIFAINRPTE